jgi:hypothetical protein
LNDHETRFYKFCLPRVIESNYDNNNDDDYNNGGSGNMAGEGNDSDHGDRPSEININIKSIESDNTNDDENNEDIASVTTSTTNTTSSGSDGTIMSEQQQQQRCYTLNVHDRWNDGMAIKNRIGWNDDHYDDDQDDDENETENENPAGYGIRFGMADKYEDFSFPDFGRTASFILCPGSATSSESLGAATATTATIVEDYIIVVHTDAPTSTPSDAPNSDIPPTLLGDYLIPFDYFSTTKKKNFAGIFPASSNLRGGIAGGGGGGSGQHQGLGVESSGSQSGGGTDGNGDNAAFSRRNGRIGSGLLLQEDGDYYP